MKKNNNYWRASLGVLVLVAAIGVFTKQIHAQTSGKIPAIKSCVGTDGSIYAFGATCNIGGGTCTPAGCPPAP